MGNLFVYGTMLHGGPNHGRVEDANFLGEARVIGRIYSRGACPAMVDGAGFVYGEVYQVDPSSLALIDTMEGFVAGRREALNTYQREVRNVQWLHKAGSIQCDLYLYNRAVSRLPWVDDGRWGAFAGYQNTVKDGVF